MAKKRRPKKPRGSRGERTAQTNGEPSEKSGVACDLMVVLPKDSTHLQSKLQIMELITRLSSTGFTHMALTHTIYGRPRPIEDQAPQAIPTSLWSVEEDVDLSEPAKKRVKTSPDSKPETGKHPPIKIFRRLHAVLENLSDVGCYLSNGPHASLLNEYDLISVAPRNDATFQAVCASATMVDIVTLDYSSGRGLKLPFKVRSSDVQSAMGRKTAFEIHFAPSVLQPKFRKALVQTSRELQTGALGKKPLVLFSSGDRTLEDSDVGAMALRMPGDLSNLMQVLLKFDPTTSNRAVGAAALEVLQRAEERRFGKSDILEVCIGAPKEPPMQQEAVREMEDSSPTAASNPTKRADGGSENDNDAVEDGFISMT